MRALIFLLPLLAGCALTSKATPVEIRYFSPELGLTHHVDPPGEAARPRVRFGRLTSSANLRYRIVHRESPVETGEYETLRWSETPEAYVRRSLLTALFSERLEQATGGGEATLDVEVVSFEEVHRKNYRGGRVALRYQLSDQRSVLMSDVLVIERGAAGPGFEPVVVAIGAAMDATTAQLATAVSARMTR